MPELLGYARVSTTEQNADLQRDSLTGAGCWEVFTDHVTGTRERRPELDRLLEQVRLGDTLVVWRLDRLGRSLRHLIDVATELGERGVGFRSLTENIDTTTAGGRLMGGQRESHPLAPPEPGVNLSAHRAPIIRLVLLPHVA